MQTIKFIAATFLLLTTTAHGADVGMITRISGAVSMLTDGTMKRVVPFVKIATGDQITLGHAARIQLVYFANGRQEIWSDSGLLEIGTEQSKSNIKPEITQLSPLVVSQLSKTPLVGQQSRTGMVRVRGLMDPDAAPKLEKQYAEMKAGAGDDITAEVFLLSGLIELREFKRAREVLASLTGNSAYADMVEHFTPIVTEAGK